MNCEDIDFILDANDAAKLTLDQKQAVDEHFASCCECRAAWAAYRELAAAPVPQMPHDLRPRIAAALSAREPAGSPRVRRSLLVGGVLVAGAAAAATIALQLGNPPSAPLRRAEEPGVSATAPGRSTEPKATRLFTTPRGDAANTGESEEPKDAAASTPQRPLDRHSIVVLAVPDPAVGQGAPDYFVECREEVVQRLREVDGLNVIAPERVSPYAGSDMTPESIARQLGAGSVLVLSTMNRAMMDQVVEVRAELGLASRVGSCRAQQLDAQTAAVRAEVARLDPEWQPNTWRAFAMDVAERVAEATFESPATLIAEAQATVLDASLGDLERIRALARLRRGPEFVQPHAPTGPDGTTVRAPTPLIMLKASLEPIPEAYDGAVIAAAVQIGLTSRNARARESAWQGLRGVHDPAVVESLMTSLASDVDENVRRAAALALGYLVEEPGVRDALMQAATQDTSDVAPIPCCIPSVRGAARRALLSDEALRESALGKVLDETLPSEERLRPLYQSLDGRGFPVQLTEEAAQAVFDIGRSAEDAILRSRAWDLLRELQNPAFMQTLLDDLAGNPAANVRASAAAALGPYVDDPGVRAALEQAETDSSISVRRAARVALDGNPSGAP